jgi:hypothetical protein
MVDTEVTIQGNTDEIQLSRKDSPGKNNCLKRLKLTRTDYSRGELLGYHVRNSIA